MKFFKLKSKLFPVTFAVFFLLQIISPTLVFAEEPKSQADCPSGTVFVAAHIEGAGRTARNVPAECVKQDDSAEGGGVIGKSLKWALGQFVNTTFLLTIGPILLLVSGSILGFAGLAFNKAIEFSILNMSNHIGGLEAIDVGWALFRDMINMGLIFILLYVSIGTILGLGGFATQKTIGNVIIVALFINFSLFGTRLIIDVSNVLAVGMYENIQNSTNIDSESTSTTGGGIDAKKQETFKTSNTGLSGAIMRPLLLTFVYNPEVKDSTSSLAGALWGTSKNILGDPWKIFITTIMGSVMMLIAAFVFFAGAIMFLIRYVVLIFIMVSSPLAFGSLAFPNGKKHFDKWLGYLTNYAFFAPVYLFLLYFVAYFLNNSNIIKQDDNFSIIINFVIAIIMMLVALIAANNFGIAGSKWATKIAGATTFGLAGWVGRSTAGRLGHTLAESAEVRNMEASDKLSTRLFGKALRVSGEAAAKSTFDLRASGLKNAGDIGKQLGSAQGSGGYKKRLEEAKKPFIETGKFVGELSPEEKARKEALEKRQKITQENLDKFKTNDTEFLRNKAEVEALQKKKMEAEKEVYLNEGDKEAKLKALDKEIADKTKQQAAYLKAADVFKEDESIAQQLSQVANVGKNRREAMGQRLATKQSLWSRVSGTAKLEAEAGKELSAADYEEKQKKKKEEENVLKKLREQMEKDKKAESTPAAAPAEEKPKP